MSFLSMIRGDDFADVGPFRELKTEFEVRDALRGEVNGDWEIDKLRLEENKCYCSENLYWEAYQMQEQP
jgi:hypothetical protein